MVQEQLESLQDETKIPKWLEEQKSSIDATFVETQRYISRISESLTKKGEESSSNTPSNLGNQTKFPI